MVLPVPLVCAGAVEVLRDAAGFAAYPPRLLVLLAMVPNASARRRDP